MPRNCAQADPSFQLVQIAALHIEPRPFLERYVSSEQLPFIEDPKVGASEMTCQVKAYVTPGFWLLSVSVDIFAEGESLVVASVRTSTCAAVSQVQICWNRCDSQISPPAAAVTKARYYIAP